MRKLVSTFVKYPFYANIIIAFLILAGSFAYLTMKKSFFPETESRIITVSVAYPGASPKEMDEGITTRIEQAVRGLVGIKEITSTSSENFCNVRIETTGEYDIDETLAEVKNAVDGISSLPSAAERPLVSKQRSMSAALFMSLSGDTELRTLKQHAYDIEDDFLASGKVSQLSIMGFPDIEISVEVNEEDMLRYELTFREIQTAIANNNIDISGGMIKSPEHEMLIRTRNRSVKPQEIGDIIFRANPDGTFLRIRDIAVVKIKFADVSNFVKHNGKQSVQIMINKLPEEDLEEISEYVKKYAKEFNEKHEEVELNIDFDFLSLLKSRLNLLYNNGGNGLLLVLVMLTLFLNVRLAGWVSWGIPSAFLAMFIIANLYGITINMISLFGMILVIGILVDDGIVIGENIFSHFEQGKSPMRAAVDGTIEVMPAVVTSISTTIVAFSPLLLIKQGGMEFMFEMAFVVVFSLFFSLAEAFFVLPAHLGNHHVLKRKEERKGFFGKIRNKLNQAIFFMRDEIYGKSLKFFIKWRWIFLFAPLAVIMITVGLFRGSLLQATFFPNMEFDNFNIDFAFKPGEGAEETTKYLAKFDSLVWEVNQEMKAELDNDSIDVIGFTFQFLGTAFDGVENGSHAGRVMVGLQNLEEMGIRSDYIKNKVKEKVGEHPELEKLKIAAQAMRFGAPVSVTLLGNNIEELEHAKEFLKDKLKNMEELTNISDNNAAGKQEVVIRLKPKAYFLGLDYNTISSQVRSGFYGGQAQRMQSGKDELRVWVRYPKSDRMTLGQFEKMKIRTLAGEFPLSELVEYDISRGPVNIRRYNGQREITVEAGLVNPDTPVPPILTHIRENFIPEMKAEFPGVDVDFQGQAKRSRETMGEMQTYFGGAFMVILLLLMLHFKSVSQALIILMMIPLAWLGSVWGHGVEGHAVSILSAWGMVALSGVIINDAVVFLAKYNSLLLEGKPVKEAVFKAGLARFRPIVLTTITTSVGLYPLILEKSFQAQFLIPMAISLAYGVLIGTAFILVFFPVLIMSLNDSKRFFRKIWTGKKPAPEEVETAIRDSKRKIV